MWAERTGRQLGDYRNLHAQGHNHRDGFRDPDLRWLTELLLHPEPLDPGGRRDAQRLRHQRDRLEPGWLRLRRAGGNLHRSHDRREPPDHLCRWWLHRHEGHDHRDGFRDPDLRWLTELLLHPEPLDPGGGTLSGCGTNATASSPVGSGYVVQVGTCTGLTTDGNHQITYADGGFTVTKATITVTVSGTQTFGGSPSFSYTQNPSTPVVGGTLSGCGTNATASSPVGSGYVVQVGTCTGLTTDGNHQITYADGGFTVTKATITVTVSGTQTFGGSPSFSYTQNPSTPVVGGTLSGCGTNATASSPVGSGYVVQVGTCTGLTTDGNHQITYADGGFTVTKANADCSSIAGYHVDLRRQRPHGPTGSCKGRRRPQRPDSAWTCRARPRRPRGRLSRRNDPIGPSPMSPATTTMTPARSHDQIDTANADCSSIAGYHVTFDGSPHTATGSCKGVDGITTWPGWTCRAPPAPAGRRHERSGPSPMSPATTTIRLRHRPTTKIDTANADCSSIAGYHRAPIDGNAHTATGLVQGRRRQRPARPGPVGHDPHPRAATSRTIRGPSPMSPATTTMTPARSTTRSTRPTPTAPRSPATT